MKKYSAVIALAIVLFLAGCDYCSVPEYYACEDEFVESLTSSPVATPEPAALNREEKNDIEHDWMSDWMDSFGKW